jgi:hypothetical protein
MDLAKRAEERLMPMLKMPVADELTLEDKKAMRGMILLNKSGTAAEETAGDPTATPNEEKNKTEWVKKCRKGVRGYKSSF